MKRAPALIALLLVVAAGLYGWLTRPPPEVVPPPRPTIVPPPAVEAFVFAPENCGFRVRMNGEPELATQPRGELTIHTATNRQADAGSVRVSCGPYIVNDRQALLAHLPKQMDQAARSAGLGEFDTDVRIEGDTVVAVYEGTRGTGPAARFVRSETRLRGSRFVEMLWMVPPDRSSAAELGELARLEPPS